jgi:hypothetical protein
VGVGRGLALALRRDGRGLRCDGESSADVVCWADQWERRSRSRRRERNSTRAGVVRVGRRGCRVLWRAKECERECECERERECNKSCVSWKLVLEPFAAGNSFLAVHSSLALLAWPPPWLLSLFPAATAANSPLPSPFHHTSSTQVSDPGTTWVSTGLRDP